MHLWIGPKPLDTIIVLEEFFFEKINVKNCSIQSSICFKLVPRLLVLEPLSEVVFRTKWELANIALPPLGNKITSSSVVCVCVCVFFQFCNLVEMAIIHKRIKANLVTNKKWNKKNLNIVLYCLLPHCNWSQKHGDIFKFFKAKHIIECQLISCKYSTKHDSNWVMRSKSKLSL